MMIRVIAVLLMLLCAGCLPYPHFQVEVSKVTGTVTRDGKPLSGATVRISEQSDWSCSKAIAEISRTDSQGKIEINGKKMFRLIRPFMGDPFYVNQLCIVTEEETYLGFLRGGVGFPPEKLNIKCDITSESVPVTEKTPMPIIHRYAVCRPDA